MPSNMPQPAHPRDFPLVVYQFRITTRRKELCHGAGRTF